MTGRRVKAVVLGGLVGTALLCAGACVSGMAYWLLGFLTWDDHRPPVSVWHLPVLLLLASLAVSLRVGRSAARDWYRNGR